MKKITLFILAAVAMLFAGCKNYDDDIDDINARLDALETWEASVNTNITALQTAITALQGKDYVTGVVALSDGSGYQITFQNSGTITIKNGTNGKDGVTPVIGAALYTDGYYYWNVNTGSGVIWLKDANGKMIRTTGDTPKMKIGDDGYWYVAADGVNFVTTGVKAQGDAVFAENGVTVGSTSVTFTLADGTTFAVPLYQALKIAEDITDDIISVTKDTTEFSVTLPKGLKKADFTSMLAKVVCNSGSNVDLKTRAAATADAWGVEMVMPTYDGDTLCNNDAKVIVIQPTSLTANNATGLLTVTLSMKDGSTLTASRTLQRETVYVCGYTRDASGYIYATIWKNGSPTVLNGDASTAIATCMAISGNDIYAGGYKMISGQIIATVWKNGVVTELAGKDQPGMVSNIAISGNDIYVVGVVGTTNNYVITSWKNGTATNITTTPGSSSATGIVVSGGSVYISGFENNENGISIGKVWKDGTPTNLSDGTYGNIITGIAISGSDFYTSGYSNVNSTYIAQQGKNSDIFNLSSGANAYAEGITIAGDDVYIVGEHISSSKSIATVWKNHVASNISDGTYNAYGSAIAVSNSNIYVTGYEDINSQDVTKVWKNGHEYETLFTGRGSRTYQIIVQ